MFNLLVTVVSGYLGSGKTTYVNQLLKNADGVRYAVLVNDFGELNIDVDLIESESDRKISLVNGCVCCSLGDDIDGALEELSQIADSLDWVILEASGVALPDRACARISNWPGFELKESITLVDVSRIRRLVDDKFVGRHVRQQLCLGGELRLTKTDLVSAEDLLATHKLIEEIANERKVSDTSIGSVNPEFVSSTFVSSTWAVNEPLNRSELGSWLQNLDKNVIRVKGFVLLDEDPENQYLLQWVEGDWTLEPIGAWKKKAETQLVLISTGV